METWRLRAGVTLEPASPETVVLVDGALGRRVKLDPAGSRIVKALDQPRTADALAVLANVDAAVVTNALTSLTRLHMIDTPAARTLAADARATRATQEAAIADVPIITRPDARFTCTMCGSCCGGHNVGPVTPEVMAGLRPHLPRLEAAISSPKGLFVELGGQVLCHSIGGSCVFLMDDRKCRIHAELGGDKKPRPCRIFPYELIATPRGVVVTIQRECRGFPEARNGKLLSESLDEVRDVLAIAGRLPIVRPVIKCGGQTADWAAYEALEERLHAIVDDPAHDTSGLLVALARALPRPTVETPPPDNETLSRELGGVAAAIASAMETMLATLPAPTAELAVKADGLENVRDAAAALLPDFKRVVADLERPDQRSLFRDHLHQALMAKDLLLADTLEAGLARIVLEWFLAKAFAIVRARQVKRRLLVTQDVMDGLVAVSFLNHHEHFRKSLLAGLDARLIEIFVDRLDVVVSRAAQLTPPETRVELVKF